MTDRTLRVFENADNIKQFTLNQNRRVVAWIADNWERLDGLTGPIHKSTVSRALCGQPVVEVVADALDVLFDEMMADPWAWCEPPTDVDRLPEYAPLSWWYKTLKPPVSWARFERLAQYPLEGNDRVLTQERLDDWRARLKAACDQYATDVRLARALLADERPEFQYWVEDAHGWRLVSLDDYQRATGKKMRRRVGNAGLHGCTPEEVGLAYALADVSFALPMVEEARLAYARPRVVPQQRHESEPVLAWNGDEFDGVEVAFVETERDFIVERWQVKNRVRYYWAGDRYEVEDVEPFAWVFDQEWRAPTQDERDILETGMTRKTQTRDEMLAQKEEWIARVQAETQAELDGGSFWLRREYPGGVVPRESIEAQFETVLARIDDEAAADERREIARRRIAFKRQLRRRAA